MKILSNFRRFAPGSLWIIASLCAAIAIVSGCVMAETKGSKIELRGDDIFIDGKKFFVKGVGYSPYRPGQSPGNPVPLDLVEKDMARIKEAGFNTIRVWDMLSDEQLELAQKYGLKVIQATYLQPNVDFGYIGFIRTAESKVKYMCGKNKDVSNIIMYLVMNEPHSQSVVESGVDKTVNLYKRLVEIAKREDPKRPISMANAFWTLWLDQSMWDVACFNIYSYCPPADEIGYRAFAKEIKELHAKNKPLVVTEMGLSVSPEGKEAYGGNTVQEQAKGLVENFRSLIDAGTAGGCIFEWNDEWWKAGSPETHNSHPEEWFGILGIEDKANPEGVLRKAYFSLKDEFMMTVINPKEGQKFIDNNFKIEIHSSGNLDKARYSLDGGEWRDLKRSDEWWTGNVDISKAANGLHKLLIEGIENKKLYTREISVIKCDKEEEMADPVKIELSTDKDYYESGDTIVFSARLTDREGKPLANHPLKIGVFDTSSAFLRKWDDVTDSLGTVSRSVPALGNYERWYYVIWAGTETSEYGYNKKIADMRSIKIVKGKGMPKRSLSAKRIEGPIIVDGVLEDVWLNAQSSSIDPNLVCQEGNICELSDLSADIRVMWDADYLYLACDITDDVPMNQMFERGDLWKGDGVELFLSVKPELIPKKGYSKYDYQVLIGSNGNMWIPSQTLGGKRNQIPVMSKAVAKKREGGYTLEAQISAKNFEQKGFTNFKLGDILGFNIGIDDKDTDSIREGVMLWNGTPDSYKNSSVWGRLKLE